MSTLPRPGIVIINNLVTHVSGQGIRIRESGGGTVEARRADGVAGADAGALAGQPYPQRCDAGGWSQVDRRDAVVTGRWRVEGSDRDRARVAVIAVGDRVCDAAHVDVAGFNAAAEASVSAHVVAAGSAQSRFRDRKTRGCMR